MKCEDYGDADGLSDLWDILTSWGDQSLISYHSCSRSVRLQGYPCHWYWQWRGSYFDLGRATSGTDRPPSVLYFAWLSPTRTYSMSPHFPLRASCVWESHLQHLHGPSFPLHLHLRYLGFCLSDPRKADPKSKALLWSQAPAFTILAVAAVTTLVQMQTSNLMMKQLLLLGLLQLQKWHWVWLRIFQSSVHSSPPAPSNGIVRNLSLCH